MLRKLQNVLALGFSQSDYKGSTKGEELPSLPPSLQGLRPDELRVLWALGEVVLSKLTFKSLDKNGEFFWLAATILKKIKELPKEENGKKPNNDHIHSYIQK